MTLFRYPRLHLAMERNNLEFAGHIYCQQALRQEWYGDVPWLEKSLMSKCAYIIYLLVLTPIFIGHWSYTQPGKDILILRKAEGNKQEATSNLEATFSQEAMSPNLYSKYLSHCKDAKRFVISFYSKVPACKVIKPPLYIGPNSNHRFFIVIAI